MKCILAALLLSHLCALSSMAAPKLTSSDKINTYQGDASIGKIKSEDNRCQECHGVDGNGEGSANGSLGKFAKLTGQYPNYLTKQIRDFRSGERKHDLMLIMAKSIDDTDNADIAAYYSNQKKMQGNGSGRNEIGKQLFTDGDNTRNIASCASCHGVNGKGVELTAQTTPIIGGQEWRYLEKQLQDWRNGERHNSASGDMSRFIKLLTDAEILALADYISGL